MKDRKPLPNWVNLLIAAAFILGLPWACIDLVKHGSVQAQHGYGAPSMWSPGS